jgi:hypothetical protein
MFKENTRLMKPGIYEMPDEEYFAHHAISNSDLKYIARSPAHFKEYKANPKEQTPAMALGSAMHCAILEPDAFMERYAVLPDNAPDKPTAAMLKAFEKGSKQQQSSLDRITFWQKFEQMNAGKPVLKNDVATECLKVGELIRNHPELHPLFSSGEPEHAVFGIDPETETLCKCKPDHMTVLADTQIVLELKSTEDARYQPFQRSAYNYNYFQGAAFYCDLLDWSGRGYPDLYMIVAFERTPPYGVMIYEIPHEAIEYGRRRYREALDVYAECAKRDYWPNYDTTVEVLMLPTWVKE